MCRHTVAVSEDLQLMMLICRAIDYMVIISISLRGEGGVIGVTRPFQRIGIIFFKIINCNRKKWGRGFARMVGAP